MKNVERCTAIRLALMVTMMVGLLSSSPLISATFADPLIPAKLHHTDGEFIAQQEPIESAGKVKVSVILSPTSEIVKLNVTFPNDADPVKISLHNVLGRLLNVLPVQSATRGETTFQIDTRNLPNGHYFVVVEALGQRVTKKLMISR